MTSATLCGEIRAMLDDGYGWEDAFIALKSRGLLREKDGPHLRRYVLGIWKRGAR